MQGVIVPGQALPGLNLSVNPAVDSAELRLLRPRLLRGAGQLGHAGVREEAAALLLGGTPLHADVKGTVYHLAVASGNSTAYERVLGMYKEVGGLVVWGMCLPWERGPAGNLGPTAQPNHMYASAAYKYGRQGAVAARAAGSQ